MINAVESKKARMILKLSITVLALLLVAGYDGDKPKSQIAYNSFDLVDKTARHPEQIASAEHVLVVVRTKASRKRRRHWQLTSYVICAPSPC